MESAGVTRQRTIVANDTVAGNHDRNSIVVIGHTDSPRSARFSKLACNITVRAPLSVRYVQELAPNGKLKGRAVKIQRTIELGPRSLEVFLELQDESTTGFQVCDTAGWYAASEVYGSQTPLGDRQGQLAQWRAHHRISHGA